jgi:hypothetical protein
MTLLFSAEVTLFRRPRARSKATRRRARSRRCVDLGVDAAAGAVGQGLDEPRLAEVDAAGQLADDHHVEAGDDLGLQRGEFGREGEGGAQIGEHAQPLAEAEQAGLGALVAGDARPLRAADGAHQHGVGGAGGGEGGGGERLAVGVVAGAAERALPPAAGRG